MSTRVFISILAVSILPLTGCLNFGEDREVLAPDVTAQHLQQVSSLTGIRFPEGSTGLAFYYLGSGIDDALAAKVAIPADRRDAFLENAIFQNGKSETPSIQIGKPKAWWRIELLTNRADRALELPHGCYVECTLGIEDGKSVVYISWMST